MYIYTDIKSELEQRAFLDLGEVGGGNQIE